MSGWAKAVNLPSGDGTAWNFISFKGGYGIGLPDGSVYIREGGEYKLRRTFYQNWFDLRYSRLTAPPVNTFYVNGATGDDNNDGTSAGSAFTTLSGAVNTISSKIYLTFAQVSISVAPGEYDGVSVSPPSFSHGDSSAMSPTLPAA